MDALFKFETLDTGYVSLAALIRHLREKEFTGRLHVVLDGYEADVFLYGSGAPNVWENDHSNGREAQGEAAMQRLLVRARDPGGTISVYVQALTECLKRVVNRVARQTEEIRFRERVAVELAVIARQQPECFSEFTSHLDRIAGTRVL